MTNFMTALEALRWVLIVGAVMVLGSLLPIVRAHRQNRRLGGDS